MKYDAIISGGGPVGATLGALLGRHKLNVLVLEKFEAVFDKPRAIVLDWEIMRVLQICGIAHDLAPHISPHTGTDFVGVEGQLIKQFDPLPPPYPLGWPATLMFVQPELERLLRDKLVSLPTVDLKLGARFETFTQDETGVTVEYTDMATGTTQQATADFLIGCDGANSQVRDALGINLTDFNFDEWWVVIDAWQKRETPLPAKTTQYCWPKRPATYVVGPDTLRRWEIKIMPGETPEDFVNVDKLNEVWGTYADTSAFELWRSATYRFNARVSEKWRDKRVFLAGDATHQTPPFLGQGLCAGMRDAANLAWKLIRAKTHGVQDSVLESYEQERLPHVSTIIEHGKAFGLIIGELDEARARARDSELREQLLSGKMVTARQGFIPNLTTGILHPDDPLAGTLMVQPKIIHDGVETLIDDIFGLTFLYIATDLDAAAWGEEHADTLAALGVERLLIGDGGHTAVDTFLRDWASQNALNGVFVRPDRYVYGGVKSRDDFASKLKSLRAFLD